MPLELISNRPGHAELQQYELEPLKSTEIRVQSVFSSTKHGTEMRTFRADSADASDQWDPELRLHVPGKSGVEKQFPMRLGELLVGKVTEVGDKVQGFKVGDRVVASGQIKEIHTADPEHFTVVPDDIPAENLVYEEAAMYGLGAVRDGRICVGDRVAVFGLGAIGLMAVQIARLAGARLVVASDPIERRRKAASKYVDHVFDPTQANVGIEIKQMTDKLGVDVSLETSSSYLALHDALRSTRYQGIVVSSAYYTGEAKGLTLSGEWHRNNLTLISSRAAAPPPREFSWDKRLMPEARRLLYEQAIDCRGLVDPIVPMSKVAETYMDCNDNPKNSIKLGIDHTLKG